MTMNFDTLLDDLRNQVDNTFFIGAHVKTKLPSTFNELIDIDTRVLMTIIDFETTQSGEAAIVILDDSQDTHSALVPQTHLLTDLELSETQRAIPQYFYHNKTYWLALGRHHSLLKGIKLTDKLYEIEMSLVSDSVVEPLTKEDMVVLATPILQTLLVPMNISEKLLLSIELIYNTLTPQINDPQTLIAKLTPIDTTQGTITWTVIEGDAQNVTIAPEAQAPTNNRIKTVTFTVAGTYKIEIASVENPDIKHSVTFIAS